MNVEIGTEAAQFPEKEYTKGIFLAVHARMHLKSTRASTHRENSLRQDGGSHLCFSDELHAV
jgi:hypothetical protein